MQNCVDNNVFYVSGRSVTASFWRRMRWKRLGFCKELAEPY